MQARQLKVVEGKATCDRCREKKPPIHEVSFGYEGVPRYWVDLCDGCFAICAASSDMEPTEFYNQILFPDPKRPKTKANRGSATTNVYGPRPRNGGFQCHSCGTTEYPLFGADEHQRQASNRSWCPACLMKVKVSGSVFLPTAEAAPLLRPYVDEHATASRARPAPPVGLGRGAPKKATVARSPDARERSER